MKSKYIIYTILIFLSNLFAKEWIASSVSIPKESDISVLSNFEESIRINFELSGYHVDNTKYGSHITTPGAVSMLIKDAPDLPIITETILIPDLAHMELTIISKDFVDVPIKDIIPSKGNITRDVNLNSIPFIKGEVYNSNSFFPSDISYLRSPHIIRSKEVRP